ncbi:unnamed protein product, partial [Adineta steineri]
MSGWQFQCANTTCLPFVTIRMLNIRNCQIGCLDQVQCQAITFHQSSSNCELFSNIFNQNRNMSINAGTITMIDMSGTRLSNGSITVSTTATTTVQMTQFESLNKLITIDHSFGLSCSSLFLDPTTYSTGSTPFSMAVADVNNDNHLDIIVANSASNNVGVLLNIGNGTFRSQTVYSVGSNPRSVAVADVNNDNKSDIVVANYNSNTTSVLLNAGNGTFLNQTIYSVGANPISIVIADMNNDNKSDISVANYNSSNIGILFNAGNGTFLNHSIFEVGSYPISLVVADVNSDNKPDIIVAKEYSN